MGDVNNTFYHFLPAVRQGLARLIAEKSDNDKRAELELSVYLNAREINSGTYVSNKGDIKVPLRLYGPGDVLGFSPKIVVRTEPQAGTYDFEPNYFPFVEFSNSDFVWRYSSYPVESLDNDNSVKFVRPWLVLVALESGAKNDSAEFDSGESEFVRIVQGVKGLPDLIRVRTESLPDLAYNWRWAHVQIDGEEDVPDSQLATILENQPDLVTSRLMCPRRLKPNRKYSCFVLPSTEIGRFSGIDMESLDDKSAYEPAWTADEGEILIPFYYTWEFHTGASGDFEHLVRILEARRLRDLGTRKINCLNPGFGTSGVYRTFGTEEGDEHTLDMEGALQSLDTRYSAWGIDPYLTVDDSDDIYGVDMLVEPARDAAIISWCTSKPGDSRLRYGESVPIKEIISESSTIRHCVELTGLSPGPTYQLKILYSSSQTSASVDGKFSIPPDSDLEFQQDLAALINKPVSEDLALEEFSIPMAEYEWLSVFDAKLLPSGSDIRVTCQTAHESTLEIQYGESGSGNHELSPVIDSELSSIHTKKISGLLPGKTYHIRIIARYPDDQVDTTEETNFTMPPLPSIVPPVYGRWHYGKYKNKNGENIIVDASFQKSWIDQLNLDPRHRAVTGYGTRVIRNNQEDLMASAWDQLGAVESINELLRRKQFGRESSKNMLNRVSQLPADKIISATAAFQPKVALAEEFNKLTARYFLTNQTLLPKSVLNSSFQKIDALMRRTNRSAYGIGEINIFERSIAGQLIFKQTEPKPPGTMVMDDITDKLRVGVTGYESGGSREDLRTPIATDFWRTVDKSSISTALADNPFQSIEGLEDQSKDGNTLGNTIDTWLNYDYTPDKIRPDEGLASDLRSFAKQITDSLNPDFTYSSNTRKLLRFDGELQSRYDREEGDSLDPVMAAPEFPQPMNESLVEISKGLLLPGLEKIKPNTIGLLKTNPRFLEAFMCGLNHEFASELLWRGYPTDQRGTYFRRFWTDYHIPTPEEKKTLLDNWMLSLGIGSVDELSREEKEIILYRHSRLLLVELKKMYRVRLASPGPDNKEMLDEINTLIRRLSENYPDAFKDISDNLFENLNRFITKMVESDCVKESQMDIEPIHLWKYRLGMNARQAEDELVLTIRGDLLKRYPNAIIYAVDGYQPDENNPALVIPAIEESIRDYYSDQSLSDDQLADIVEDILSEHPAIHPIFGAQLLPDITFLGFPFSEYKARRTEDRPGKFFVIEEHVGEPRFGLDIGPGDGNPPSLGNPANWNNLSWEHFELTAGDYIDVIQTRDETRNITEDKWEQWMNSSSAKRARITLQKPVRIIIGANDMLPD